MNKHSSLPLTARGPRLQVLSARGDSSGPKTSGEAGTDVWALRQGAIAVTPLRAAVAEADGSELGDGFRV